MEKRNIMVVDDDPAILRLLTPNLRARGYEVTLALNGEECLKLVEQCQIDTIILDLMMPGMSGLDVCQRIREWSTVPIIILSARGDEKDKVRSLELGADDYLTKPFSIAELMARVKTALRHADAARNKAELGPSTVDCGELAINLAMRRVTVRGEEMKLTPTEYSLLQQLAVNAGKVLTHSMLLEAVWGGQYRSEKEYLRVFVGRLRKKLEEDPERPSYILTDTGVGYHLSSGDFVKKRLALSGLER